MQNQKSSANPEESRRIELQKIIDSGTSVAQLARDNKMPASTMRLQLKKLGVTMATRAVDEKRAIEGYCLPKILNSVSKAQLIDQIADRYGINVKAVFGTEDKLEMILKELVKQIPNVKIAEVFGVSEAAVRKWLKKYNITSVGNGNWRKIEVGLMSAEELLAEKQKIPENQS